MDKPTRIDWADIVKAARDTSEALNGPDWTSASIKARVLLADLADEHERLRRALEAIAEYEPDPDSHVGPYDQIAEFAKKRARAALRTFASGHAPNPGTEER